ncbi:MAG: cytochrome c biogenesis protein ResB [Moorea sp. SIO2B7]|nr:cytochrome c biogenesis protein ResB [Moorena sp. SIO2B7]
MFQRIFHLLGSIKMAVPLLIVITTTLIGATFYEAQVGSAIVQQIIYKSPWFGLLMFLLAVNLGVSAATRYPWRGTRKIGFALTHIGLIVIIAGSAAVIHLGTEGLITLKTEWGANNQVRLEGEQLEVMNPDGKIQKTDLLIKSQKIVNPQTFAGLSLLDYSENTIQTVNFTEGATVPNLAVKINLHSELMGQTLEKWLAIAPVTYSKIALGPAELQLLQVNTESELQELLFPPKTPAIGVWGKLQINSENQTLAIDVKQNLNQTISLVKDLSLKITNFWSDFGLDRDNQPINRSENFNNPAVALEVTSATGIERWFVFSKPEFPPIRSLKSGSMTTRLELNYEIKPQEAPNYFKIITTREHQLYYVAKSSQGLQSGTLEVNQSVNTGWADFQITLAEIVNKAQIKRQIVPISEPNFEGVPGLKVETNSGKQKWLTWGQPTTINDPEGEIFAAFMPKLLDVPFAIALEDFIVQRNEGSDSVAMWTSKIRIEDTQNNTTESRKVWMNHPTWYKGWKIAQASWNPGDLSQSTLQVKREPMWVTALTWTGSSLVVLGITVMFYGRSLSKKLPQKSTDNIVTDSETVITSNQELVNTK